MSYEVKISFVVTENGNPHSKTELSYANVGYDTLTKFERIGANLVDTLVKWGEAEAKRKE
jgi:hypothetical protein